MRRYLLRDSTRFSLLPSMGLSLCWRSACVFFEGGSGMHSDLFLSHCDGDEKAAKKSISCALCICQCAIERN